MARLEIEDYSPEWPVVFRELGSSLRAALGAVALRIDHIGSTAVPGLAAKPVIDVQVSVAAFEPLDAYRVPLARIGFVHRSDNPDRTKRYFREAPGSGRRRTHIHVREAGTFAEQCALLLRAYLREHPTAAERYAAAKRRLAMQHVDDRRAYSEAKAADVWQIIRSADDWAQQQGWRPPARDA